MAVRVDRPLSNVINTSTHKKIKHGLSRSYFYRVWMMMKVRCTKENNIYYKNYGGRGIAVSQEWMEFENFKQDMYQKYIDNIEKFGSKNTTLDRIDNDGNYCLENCRWASFKTQNNNKRKYVWKNSITKQCKEIGISRKLYYLRIQKGWDKELAISTPK